MDFVNFEQNFNFAVNVFLAVSRPAEQVSQIYQEYLRRLQCPKSHIFVKKPLKMGVLETEKISAN